VLWVLGFGFGLGFGYGIWSWVFVKCKVNRDKLLGQQQSHRDVRATEGKMNGACLLTCMIDRFPRAYRLLHRLASEKSVQMKNQLRRCGPRERRRSCITVTGCSGLLSMEGGSVASSAVSTFSRSIGKSQHHRIASSCMTAIRNEHDLPTPVIIEARPMNWRQRRETSRRRKVAAHMQNESKRTGVHHPTPTITSHPNQASFIAGEPPVGAR